MARHRARYRMEGLRREDLDRGQPAQARLRRQRWIDGGPLTDQNERSNPAPGNPLVAAIERSLAFCNNIIVVIAAVALIAACAILSYSVLSRALFHSAHFLEDETGGVFLGGGA